MDRLFCARAVPIISVTLARRCATSSSMHSANVPAADSRRSTGLTCSFRFGFAARRVVGALHGVDGHFDLVPPPTPTRSDSLASSRIGIGAPELAARSAGDATSPRAAPPVVTLSAIIAWSAVTLFVVTCLTVICCWPRPRWTRSGLRIAPALRAPAERFAILH